MKRPPAVSVQRQPDGPAHASRILIVDDEPHNRRVIEVMIVAEGHTVVTAASGSAALALIAEHPPDLILLDVMMPGMDGYQVAATLKDDPATNQIPIIMVTALDDHVARMRGLTAGAEDFLTKPVDRTELTARVRNLLRLKTYADVIARHNQNLEAEVSARTAELRLERDRARQAEERIAFVLRASSVGMWDMDYTTGVLQWSEILEGQYGLAPGAFGRTFEAFLDRVHPDDRDVVRATVGNASASGTEFTLANRSIWPDGSVHWMTGKGRMLVGVDGETVRGVGISIDVTEPRRRLEEVEQLKSGFLATVSHELRTPLTSIRGSLGLLGSEVLGPLSDEARGVVAIAERNAGRLMALINDILDLERLQTGKIELQRANVSIDAMVRRALESVAMVAQHGVTVHAPETAGMVWADPERIVQVLVNLLSNAVKFSPAGGRVTLTVRSGEDGVEFRVSDRGRGVPAAYRQVIFERFRQIESSDARKMGGIGLGLAICHSIVHEHGGTIGVDSAEGAGSTFWFRLPPQPAPSIELTPLDAKALAS